MNTPDELRADLRRKWNELPEWMAETLLEASHRILDAAKDAKDEDDLRERLNDLARVGVAENLIRKAEERAGKGKG
jgi:hypothetical protein